MHEKSLLYTCGKLSFLGFQSNSKSVAYLMCSFTWYFLENWMIFFVLLTFYAYLQIWRIFRDKKTKRWSPTTKTTYKQDLTLKMLSLHLYESTILTLWIHSSKIRVNDADSYTKWCCIFILKLLCYRDWSTHFSL